MSSMTNSAASSSTSASASRHLDLEPNPFEQLFEKTATDKGHDSSNGNPSGVTITTTSNSSTAANGSNITNNTKRPDLTQTSNQQSSSQLPLISALSPPILTPGGRRVTNNVLPPLLPGGISPGGSSIPGTPSIWANFLQGGTNTPGFLGQQNFPFNVPASQSQDKNTLPIPNNTSNNNNNNNNIATSPNQYMQSTKKPTLTSNDSSMRTGLTPGPGGLMPHASFTTTNSYSMMLNLPVGPLTPNPLTSFLGATTNQNSSINLPSTAANTTPSRIQNANSVTQNETIPIGNISTIKENNSSTSSSSVPSSSTNNNNSTIENIKTEDETKKNLEHTEPKEPLEKAKTTRRTTKRTNSKKSENGPSAKKLKESTDRKKSVSQDESEAEDDRSNNEENDQENTMISRTKLTEEQKRQNFLERNRLAASKCRQRKKKLVKKMEDELEFYSSQYNVLTSQVSTLQNYFTTIKQILHNHKLCPSLQDQVGGIDALNSILNAAEYTSQLPHPAPSMMNGSNISSTTTLNAIPPQPQPRHQQQEQQVPHPTSAQQQLQQQQPGAHILNNSNQQALLDSNPISIHPDNIKKPHNLAPNFNTGTLIDSNAQIFTNIH